MEIFSIEKIVLFRKQIYMLLTISIYDNEKSFILKPLSFSIKKFFEINFGFYVSTY